MEKNKRLYYFSHLMILFTGFLFLISLVIENPFKDQFLLYPQLVISQNQWWRILTYPIINNSFANILLFFVTFLVFAPKLEEIYKSFLFPILLIILIISQGVLVSAIYFNENIVFYGMVGINFFIITNFLLIYHKRNILILNRYSMPSPFFIAFLLLFWLAAIIGDALINNLKYYFIQNFSLAIIGTITGLISFLHLKFTHKPSSKSARKNKSKKKKIDIPNPDELSLTIIANKELQKVNEKLKEDLEIKFQNSSNYYDEERLNQILDKINLFGYHSLNEEEINFLKNYSKN